MLEKLTVAEYNVLILIVEGLRNKEIAKVSCISINTVKSNVKKILQKLNQKNRLSAAIFSVKNGIIK